MKATEAEMSYFPGCSMATSARESNAALMRVCRRMGIELIELEDWNCCGSSSTPNLDPGSALSLSARNLSLASPSRPLMVMCPGCHYRLLLAHQKLASDPQMHAFQENRWGRSITLELEIIHFLDLLKRADLGAINQAKRARLQSLKVAPYYGCMLARPPALRKMPGYYGAMEHFLNQLGAEPRQWRSSAKCCGTFLAAARPDIATPLVSAILLDAAAAGAECIVTACAMCQLNLEIRRTAAVPAIPILHLSELIALAFNEPDHEIWFRRHLIDPRPVLRKRGLLS